MKNKRSVLSWLLAPFLTTSTTTDGTAAAHRGLGPKGEAIIRRDDAVMSTSYTREYPLVVDHGRGAEVWDVDGNRFLDFMSGIAVASTGHAHPHIVQAIKEQAERFLHICLSDFYYDVGVQLAEKLAAIAPFEEDARVFFTNSGTETVEAAIKLARYATGRKRFIAFRGSFHGRTMGSLALTSSKYTQQKHFFPAMPGVTHVPYPDTYRQVLANPHNKDYGEVIVDYIEEMFKRNIPADQVAAIVVEPIQGEGGYIIPPPGFLPALRDLCDRHSMLLIADEVQSGIGRTGKWWAIEHDGVEPDIVTSAKGLASGMPLGALIARKSLMDWQPGSHGSTFGGNPVSCAAAIATLEVIEDGLVENAAHMGAYLLEGLCTLKEKHPLIGDVRGRGLMIGMEIVSDRDDKTPAPDLRNDIIQAAFEEGLLLLGAGESVLRLMPPLTLDQATADEGLHLIDKAISRVQAKLN